MLTCFASSSLVPDDRLRVLCATWNVGGAKPTASEHSGWLPAMGRGFELVVVGTQENHHVRNMSFSSSEHLESLKDHDLHDWELMVLERLGSEWAVVKNVGLMAMSITVFARKHAIDSLITDVQSGRSATGLIAGHVGNKGGTFADAPALSRVLGALSR
jgi:hypothetical protein